jgi:hypothetical protein
MCGENCASGLSTVILCIVKFTVQSTVFAVQSDVCAVWAESTVFSVQSAVHAVEIAVFSVQSPVFSVGSTCYGVQGRITRAGNVRMLMLIYISAREGHATTFSPPSRYITGRYLTLGWGYTTLVPLSSILICLRPLPYIRMELYNFGSIVLHLDMFEAVTLH